MKLLYFGIYSKGIEYPRNNNIIRALRELGHEVLESHYDLAGSFSERIGAVSHLGQRIRFAIGLLASYLSLSWSFLRHPCPQAIIVGSPGYFHVHLAYFLNVLLRRHATLIYDAFIPLYEALVEDRQLVSPHKIVAHLVYRFEKACCQLADIVLVDTQCHGQYLTRKYGLDERKVICVFVGSTIHPCDLKMRKIDEKLFNILFVGTYIPLHGIDVILEAARFLRDDQTIRFIMVGAGQLRQEMEKLADTWKLENIIFWDWIPTESLGATIRQFDLTLGIFGTTPKTGRVIPSKVYDICAAGVPFITADTPAIREVFAHGNNAYLIPAGDATHLARAILNIKQDDSLRQKIASGTKRTSQIIFSSKRLVDDMVNAIRIVNKE